ncbi:MAG: hypothetical protein FJ297_14620 [Planctomycetes bacterium]|nr:hypothetical protein [Planctomycetota bacterium]
MRVRWRRWCALFAWWIAPALAVGEDRPFPADSVESRLDALERQSAELLAGLDSPRAESRPPDPAGDGYEVGTDLGMTANWNHGLELSTRNKDFRVHVGGRTQFDAGWFDADPNLHNANGTPTTGLGNNYGDGVDFRRARLRIDGTMYETMDWAVEYDFVNAARYRGQRASPYAPLAAPPGSGVVPPDTSTFMETSVTAFTDLWWTFKSLPIVGNIRIGNQKEAIGFEHLVSSRFQPFIERSYNQDTFYGGTFNGFSPGVSFFNTYGEEDIGTWNVGVFKPMNSVFSYNTGDGDYSLVARITRLLWYADEGRGLVHVGVSGRQATAYDQAGALYNSPISGTMGPGRIMTFRTRDALRTGLSVDWPTPANITLFGDDMQWLNSEFVVVHDRWTIQSEYLVSGLQDARAAWDAPLGTAAVYHGGYFQIFRFLTDDHDNYNKKTGAFDRVIPTENFFLVRGADGLCTGRGAWQVGARYNYLDLNDGLLNGGILHNLAGGVNWFLNPNTKMQFNYIATYRDAPIAPAGPVTDPGDGWVHGWGFRLAHDF